MKKLVTVGAALLATLTLAACGSSSSSDKGTDTMKSSKKASSSTKKETKADLQVTNGSPEKVGQWKYFSDFDADGTLVAVATPNQKISQGKVENTIKAVKIYKMAPKNADAKKTASDYFSASGVTDPYYVLQVLWSAKNSDKQELQTNGIKSFVVNGQQYSPNAGLQDEAMGATLAAGSSSDFESDALLKTSAYKSIKSFTMNLDTICTTSSFEDVSAATSATINL